MDTGRLKRFSTEARTILMHGVKNRLQALGFDLKTGKTEELPQEMDGGAVFMNDVVSTDFYRKWMSLYQNVQARSIREVAEEAAYTWFNRFMAIRIMEKRGFIAPVLEYESEDIHIPAIVNEATQGRLPQMTETVHSQLMDLLDDPSKVSEQFALLIVAYCHDNPIINNCFGTIADYTELLLPVNILSDGGFVDMVNETTFITDEQYASAELIGWLYQFYISDRKDEAFAKKGKYDPDEIAPATQIFTPNWIVKYMVQNTIGRIYLDNNPYEDELKAKWQYLVEPTEKTPKENIFQFDDLKDLKTADLASGSGHILNEGFDILFDLYINEGYSRTEAIKNIFRYNLVGIDIDTRAKQLGSKDKSLLDAKLMPRVYSMPRPIIEVLPDYRSALSQFLLGTNQKMLEELMNAIQLMNHADTLGSIMIFDISESTRNTVMIRVQEYEEQMAQGDIVTESNRLLLPYMNIILALTDKYAAICMNPPYMYSSNMPKSLLEYVNKHYDDGRTDLCVSFMRVAQRLLATNGKYSMINMHSWMFLTSFFKLRNDLLTEVSIDSLLHLGSRTFDELSGEVVQNVAFTITNNISSSSSICYRLIDGNSTGEKENLFLKHKNENYIINQNSLKEIPGQPLAYWASPEMIEAFKDNKLLNDLAYARVGMFTGDNNRFLREWWEISSNMMSCHTKNNCSSIESGKKWFGYNKGGGYKKWYGNLDLVVNYQNGGYEIFELCKQEKRNCQNYPNEYKFREGITWTGMASDNISFRFLPNGCLFDSNKGPMIYTIEGGADLMYILAFLNTIVCNSVANVLNPTLSKQINDILNIPLANCDSETKNLVMNLAKSSVDISKTDWDNHETSWDFETHPLLKYSGGEITEEGETADLGIIPDSVEELYKMYKAEWEVCFEQLHENEEELNRQFIDIYGLQDELTPDVPLDEITILQQGEIKIEGNELKWNADVVMKQLISYAIGCMMGRFSIDKPGLILANQGDGLEQFNKQVPDSRFDPDDDGIIPLMSAQSDFADNATIRFKQWLVAAFGEETLVENLNFIEKCLGKSIDDYFVKDFWKDHKKMYQNRPIYWLFSSKKGAFQCLTYMHRMDAYTAERIRTKYLLPHIEWLIQKQGEMEANAANLNARERKELDNIGKQIEECREYHDRLHVIADKQIAFDLDDGVVVNYAKFGDVLAKIK